MKRHKVKNRVFYSIWLKLIIIFILILSPVYFLGGIIFHRTYLEMQRQTVNSQTSQLNLYAGTINEELSRIHLHIIAQMMMILFILQTLMI